MYVSPFLARCRRLLRHNSGLSVLEGDTGRQARVDTFFHAVDGISSRGFLGSWGMDSVEVGSLYSCGTGQSFYKAVCHYIGPPSLHL